MGKNICYTHDPELFSALKHFLLYYCDVMYNECKISFKQISNLYRFFSRLGHTQSWMVFLIIVLTWMQAELHGLGFHCTQ